MGQTVVASEMGFSSVALSSLKAYRVIIETANPSSIVRMAKMRRCLSDSKQAEEVASHLKLAPSSNSAEMNPEVGSGGGCQLHFEVCHS